MSKACGYLLVDICLWKVRHKWLTEFQWQEQDDLPCNFTKPVIVRATLSNILKWVLCGLYKNSGLGEMSLMGDCDWIQSGTVMGVVG